MPSFGLEKLAFLHLVWLHSIDQGICRWSPTLFQVDFHIYQKGKRRDLRGCQNCASGLCCHMLPYVECYDERLAALSLTELSVYLDICYLKYVDKLRKDYSHIPHHYLHWNSSDDRRPHKTPTPPKPALLSVEITFSTTTSDHSITFSLIFFVVFLKTHGLICFSHSSAFNNVHVWFPFVYFSRILVTGTLTSSMTCFSRNLYAIYCRNFTCSCTSTCILNTAILDFIKKKSKIKRKITAPVYTDEDHHQ